MELNLDTSLPNTQFCPTVTDKFYREMGYNGTVTFKFSTPICYWLDKIYAEMTTLPSFKGYVFEQADTVP